MKPRKQILIRAFFFLLGVIIFLYYQCNYKFLILLDEPKTH